MRRSASLFPRFSPRLLCRFFPGFFARFCPRSFPRIVLTLVVLAPLTGCYYGHLAQGQLRMLWQSQPLEEAAADANLPPRTRALLGLVEQVRHEARTLGLEVGGQYTSYVDWPGDRVVTTLVRTHLGTLDAEPWWFPFLGDLPYKGYFDRERAESEAERIREGGEYEVCVSGVAAYSTLGWLDDPVTGPMLARGAAHLVETIFHELVHATAFVPGEAEFNEGAAQFIGQQAAIRFFADHPASPFPAEASIAWPDAARVRDAIADRDEIAASMLAFKATLEALDGRPDRAARRDEAERAARAHLAALPLRVLDAERVAERARLSDACLALRGAYVGDAKRHAIVFDALDESLPLMIERLRVWAEEERPTEAFFHVDSHADSHVDSPVDPARDGVWSPPTAAQ